MKKALNSVYDLEWNPRIFIEASAGTGKTYTIVSILIRLLVEKKLELDQILVMTFTKKATSELRERIFERLNQSLNALEIGYTGEDTFLKELQSNIADPEDAKVRFRNAIQDFDDAQVTTIHGFCQKILKEEALLAGTPFDPEVIQQDEMLQQASEDFWRAFLDRYKDTEGGRYYTGKLLGIAKNPAELRNNLGGLFSKPYADIEGEGIDDPVSCLEKVLDVRKKMAELWNNEKWTITQKLLNCDLKGYTEKNVSSRVQAMDQFVRDELFAQDDFDQLRFFTSDYVYDESNLKKNKTKLPSHSFFDVCNEYSTLIPDIKKVETQLLLEIHDEISERRKKLAIQSETVTYDDLLINVRDALLEPESGVELAEVLRKKYPFALVDEFQDTDPVQYSIFNSIFPEKGSNTGLFMIGDPKQAIYGFRGADVYTYFKAAKESSGTFYTLKNNYRSSPVLIEAVNELYELSDDPFIEDAIGFFRSDPGSPEKVNDLLIDGKPPVPLKITAREGIQTNKALSKDFALNQTVTQIAGLLEKAERGEVTLKGNKLKASDIAVLVSRHDDAELMKQKLKAVGVDAVTYSREKVFESFEAMRLQLVMQAVLEPLNRKAVNSALLSGFFGDSLDQVFEWRGDEEKWQLLTEVFQNLHELWLQDGFYPMFQALLYNDSRLLNFARMKNSERILTNLYQLADICEKAEKEGKLDPFALYSWFTKEMADPDKDEEKTLLLESDQNLVKISTIHNSKGLEFPVVFCPVLWEGMNKRKRLLEEYHHPESQNLIINIEQQESETRAEAAQLNQQESVAEEVRKTYVSITRASGFCSLIWDTHSASHFSGLGTLLIGKQRFKEVINNNYKTIKENGLLTDQDFLGKFQELKANHPDLIDLTIDDRFDQRFEKVEWEGSAAEKLNFKPYNGRITLPVQQRLESFSSLASHKAEPGEPDYDQIVASYTEMLQQDDLSGQKSDIFNFPRGATAGTAIHKIFEHENFDFADVSNSDFSGLIEEVLNQYRFDLKWMPVLQKMIRDVTGANYPGFELGRVQQQDQLREMEFHFQSGETNLAGLFEIIRKNGMVPRQDSDLRGFMTGFIDLIIRQNNKFYIIDYKSNHLGHTPEDYSPEKVEAEIKAAHYDLQYHLYIVALVKYLRKRIAGFNYEEHFGGAAYLFVRGMREGSGNGIWFHKPEKEIIQNLEHYLSGKP